METIGMRISRAMKDAKVSQTSLANAMGVDQQHVSRMLKMADAEMKIGFVIGAAEALKLSPQYVIFGEAGLSDAPAPVIAFRGHKKTRSRHSPKCCPAAGFSVR